MYFLQVAEEGGHGQGGGEAERQVSVAGAEKMRLNIVIRGIGERSGCQTLDGLTRHTVGPGLFEISTIQSPDL